MTKDGTVETVGDMIKLLQEICKPEDKIQVTDGWNVFIENLLNCPVTVSVVKRTKAEHNPVQ